MSFCDNAVVCAKEQSKSVSQWVGRSVGWEVGREWGFAVEKEIVLKGLDTKIRRKSWFLKSLNSDRKVRESEI